MGLSLGSVLEENPGSLNTASSWAGPIKDDEDDNPMLAKAAHHRASSPEAWHGDKGFTT
jgi:hypothetical protein